MENKVNKILVWVVVILIILVMVLIGFIVYKEFFYKEESNKDETKIPSVEPIKENDKITGKVEFSNNRYVLDISNYKNKDEVYYKINNDYEVKLVFLDNGYNTEDSGIKTFDVYVNDKFVLTDDKFNNEQDVYFSIIKDNLVYLNTGFTDIRSEHVYIIEKDNRVHDIYELDKIKGMVPEEITLNEDSIVIKGTRINHGPTVVYGESGMDVMLDDPTTWTKYGINNDTIIKATYTYKIDSNNKFNLEPDISNEMTIKEYLENNYE